jgi:hypothetical protein
MLPVNQTPIWPGLVAIAILRTRQGDLDARLFCKHNDTGAATKEFVYEFRIVVGGRLHNTGTFSGVKPDAAIQKFLDVAGKTGRRFDRLL